MESRRLGSRYISLEEQWTDRHRNRTDHLGKGGQLSGAGKSGNSGGGGGRGEVGGVCSSDPKTIDGGDVGSTFYLGEFRQIKISGLKPKDLVRIIWWKSL